jgi:hypothetical protein
MGWSNSGTWAMGGAPLSRVSETPLIVVVTLVVSQNGKLVLTVKLAFSLEKHEEEEEE